MTDRHESPQQPLFVVALFDSTSDVLMAERLVKDAGVPYKIIPVPRHLSSDCGVCLRVPLAEKDRLEDILTAGLDEFTIARL